MKLPTKTNRQRCVATLLITGIGCASTGCATLAHRTRPGQRLNPVAACDGESGPCPLMAGDAALLMLGVVPGAIALVIDFSTGAWMHPDHQTRKDENRKTDPMSPDVQTRRVRHSAASTSVLFTPGRARR